MVRPALAYTAFYLLAKTPVGSFPTAISTMGSGNGSSDPIAGNVSLIEYFHALQAASLDDCWWGTITCPNGEELCNNPINYVGCSLDVLTPIVMDFIAEGMGEVLEDFSEFTNDPVGFTVDFGVDLINEKVNDLVECYKGVSGQSPRCSELNSLKTCVSTAANALSVARTASVTKLTVKALERLDSGLGKVDKVISMTDAQCKLGCEGGVCGDSDGNAAVTRVYSVPDGCECRDMEVTNEDGSTDITPTECGRNFITKTSKIDFSYMGCYVGITSSPETYSECPSAYESNVIGNAMFVRCVDQFGETLELPSSGSSTIRVPGLLVPLLVILVL
ncbi:unnamed protein product [Phytophthora lilii]|uniref:Unnamed protein product n=1 Tax=Phytophthora lilii TaxID=2077276 RepID=A0A9W6TIH9_9STRA|nr:unnamed protein product [Phytophthora lilii]